MHELSSPRDPTVPFFHRLNITSLDYLLIIALKHMKIPNMSLHLYKLHPVHSLEAKTSKKTVSTFLSRHSSRALQVNGRIQRQCNLTGFTIMVLHEHHRNSRLRPMRHLPVYRSLTLEPLQHIQNHERERLVHAITWHLSVWVGLACQRLKLCPYPPDELRSLHSSASHS